MLVSTPTRERLATAVEEMGGRVELQDGSGRLLIEGMDAAQVGELAYEARIVVHELTPRNGSLEDVFFDLTEEEAA